MKNYDFEKLVNTQQFLKPATIREYYHIGLFNAVVALRLYFASKMRLSDGCYETKKTIAENLDMPIGTIKRACKTLGEQGFIYQDGFKSKIESNGKKFYRKLWHFGKRQEEETSRKANPVENEMSRKANLLPEDVSRKANPTLAVKRTPKEAFEPKSEPHTLEEDYIEEDITLEKDQKSATASTVISSSDSSGYKHLDDSHFQYSEYFKDDLKDALKTLNETDFTSSFRLANSSNLEYCFNKLLKAYGFKWNTNVKKDTSAAGMILKALHPTWRNNKDIRRLLWHYTKSVFAKKIKGEFELSDLWLNTFKDRIIKGEFSKPKPNGYKWS